MRRRLRADLGAYVLDRLAPGEREVIDAHVLVCARCRAEAAGLAPVAAYLGRADRDLVVGFLTGAPQSENQDVPNKQ